VTQRHPHHVTTAEEGATLPVGQPRAAATELERAVRELGFVGTMIAGTIGDRFLDDPEFTPILEAADGLDVPIYLHPAPPPKRVADIYYNGAFNRRVAVVHRFGLRGHAYDDEGGPAVRAVCPLAAIEMMFRDGQSEVRCSRSRAGVLRSGANAVVHLAS
jgi:hypothetical protein